MKISVNISKLIAYIGIMLFFISGTIYVMEDIYKYQRYCLILGIVLIIFCQLLVGYQKIQKPISVVSASYFMLVVSIVVSSLINYDLEGIAEAVGLALIWIVGSNTVSTVMSRTRIKESSMLLVLALLIIILLVAGLTTSHLSAHRYQGNFRNANQVGNVANCALTILFALYSKRIFNRINNNLYIKIFAALCWLIPTLFLLISNSRSAIFTTIIQTVFFFIYMYKSSSTKLSYILLVLILILIGWIVIQRIPIISQAIHEISTKMAKYDGSNDALNGRTDKWEIVFSRLKFFGNGTITSFGTHNTYFSMLDQFGVLSFISLIVFVISGIVSSTALVLKEGYDDCGSFLMFNAFIAFGCIGLLEGMMLKTTMLLCVYGCHSLHKNYNYDTA